jgi:hypothetical protein
MTIKFAKIFLLLLALQLVLPVPIALADTGPKPSMDFEFRQDSAGEPLTITSGILYECEQSDCSDAAPLEELGPQGFYCQVDSCYATAYGFAPYHRLEIQFSDGRMRQSNVFETAGFDSRYTVTIRPEDLLVEAQFSLGVFPRTFTVLIACLCALVGTSLVAGLAVFLMRRAKKS